MTCLLRVLTHTKSLSLNPNFAKPNVTSQLALILRFSHDSTPSYPRNWGWINREYIGNREVVGHGRSSKAIYDDHYFWPFPAIRYKVFEGDLLLLREKEKGHWKDLTPDEKRELYRASFRQTFAEFAHGHPYPDNEMYGPVGLACIIISIAVLYYTFLKAFILPPLPTSMTPEGWEKSITKQIQLGWNPITGIASKWDYERDQWKAGVRPWFLKYLPADSPLRRTGTFEDAEMKDELVTEIQVQVQVAVDEVKDGEVENGQVEDDTKDE